jgi:hypothetical protein
LVGFLDDKILKITRKNHFNILKPLIIFISIGLIIIVFSQFEKYMVMTILFANILNGYSALYLHYKYYKINKNEEYEIRHNKIIKRKNGKTRIFHSNEIEKITAFLSSALVKGNHAYQISIDEYHYVEVKLKTGEKLILTCLLANRIDKAVKKMHGVNMQKSSVDSVTLLEKKIDTLFFKTDNLICYKCDS